MIHFLCSNLHFRDTLLDCGLQDIGFEGNPFTCSNHREDSHFVQERLDRFVASPSWISLFPTMVITIFPVMYLITFLLYLLIVTIPKNGGDNERFEPLWLQEPGLLKLWSNFGNPHNLLQPSISTTV